MEELAKKTLWGRTLVEAVQELAAAGKIHPHLAKTVMYSYVLENKPDLPFLSNLQINARELVQYRRRGRVLEVRLRDVNLDRVFNHARSNYKSYEILSKFAHVTHLTIFAFDCHQEKETEAYLGVLSQLLDTDVSGLKKHFLPPMEPEHEAPPENVSYLGKHLQILRKIPEVSMQQPSLNAVEVMTEPEHVTPFEDVPCLRKHQKGKRGRPRKVSTYLPPLDAMDLITQPEHVTPFEDVPCLRTHQKGKRGRPRKVSTYLPPLDAMDLITQPEHVTPFEDVPCLRTHRKGKRGRPRKVSTYLPPLDAMDLITQPEHVTPFEDVPCLRTHRKGKRGRPRNVSTHQPPLNAVDSMRDSMISPRRSLVTRRPRGRSVWSQRHAAESTAYDGLGDIGRRGQCRDRAGDSVAGVTSPQNALAKESVQEAKATYKGSTGTVKASRRRRGRPSLGRGTILPQDTPETLQEVSYVSQRKDEAIK